MGRSEDRAGRDRHEESDDDSDDSDSPPIRRVGRKSENPRHRESSEGMKKKRKLESSRHGHRHRHHPPRGSASSSAADTRPAAAAAAAHQQGAADVAAATLLEHFSQILQGEGPEQPDSDVQKARNALEATAGNMQMAAQLYWDDYFASAAAEAAPEAPQGQAQAQAQHAHAHEHDSDKKVAARKPRQKESSESEGEDVVEVDVDLDRHPPLRRLRRSLDKDFRAADAPPPPPEPQDDDDDMQDNDDDDEADDHVPPRQLPRQLLADAVAGHQVRLRAVGDTGGESVSVSDDEAVSAGVWRIVGSMVAQLDDDDDDQKNSNNKSPRRHHRHHHNHQHHKKIREAAAAVANKVLPPQASSDEGERKHRHTKEETEDDQDYISDSDWLEEEGASIRSPFELLWGAGDRASGSSSSVNNDNERAEGNVVADEEAADQQNEGGIPHTWLNASFALSECGTALEVKPPKTEDIEFFAWRQQQGNGRSNGAPPPYHCKAITAILSVVTAMIYTGASIQSKEVNCTSAKKPFLELTPEERKREFEPRLADALSALIFIAAKASMERKRRAIEKLKKDPGFNVPKRQNMQRRLRLIPTCSWEDDPSSGMPRPPDGPLYRSIQVATSLTNIHDIHLYVLSTMRSFTARGGVALLLETILRIHGKGVVARMVQRARQEAKLPTDTNGLIACTCEERQKKMYEEKPLPASVRNDPTKMLDTTPPGHECVSVELLSLLTSGQVHSTWKGWVPHGVDFGFLTRTSGEVGCLLARPEKPVWVLQGETGYSVLWLEEAKEMNPRTVAKLDQPGTALGLGHWNCWYGQRNKSGMRVITAPATWKPPSISSKGLSEDVWKKSSRDPLESRDTTELLLERRHARQANLVSADEHEANETKERESRILPEALERAKPHPDDEKYYPGKHTMWRFDMKEKEDAQDDASSVPGDSKMIPVERWVPYHRLTGRQKLVVEMKMGPKIKSILWTRWPGATVDTFTPADEGFPIV